jgi:hypothetical protein
MPSPSTPCDSVITRVDLYARGALVTRRALLPADLDASAGLTLTLSGLSPMARLGSFRALAAGGGVVLGLDADLVLPTRAAPEQGARAQVQALRRRVLALDAQIKSLQQRRALLSHPPDMGLRGRRPNTHPASRALDALAVSDLMSSLAADLDAQLADLAAAARATRDALSSAEAALQQASSAVESSNTLARPTLHIRFAPHAAPPTSLEVTYEVPAARWWPAYTLRLDSASRRARLSLEAFISQDTFEDWSDAQLSLITADLSAQISLPELSSLRLGRPRPPKHTGFRAPPNGLDLLFLGFDAIKSPPLSHTQAGTIHPAALRAVHAIALEPSAPSDANVTRAGTMHPEAVKAMKEGATIQDILAAESQRLRSLSAPASSYQGPPPEQTRTREGVISEQDEMTHASKLYPTQDNDRFMMQVSAPKSRGGVLSAIGGAAAAVVAAPVVLADALLRDRPQAKKSSALARSAGRSRQAPPPRGALAEMSPSDDALDGYGGFGGGGGPGGVDGDGDSDAPLDLDMQWLNFDLLILARFDAGSARGRLRPKPSSDEAPAVRDARARLLGASPPPGASDPQGHRGSFDHRYDAVGSVEVPADGVPHRVHLLTADAPYDTRFVSVPAEMNQVFRMVDITNPLSAPLLPGPADVFVDGALIITSPLPKTDSGGHFSLGLGVEERVTIARNVRTQEQRRGLLKGTTHVENTIHIEVTSALASACRIDVLDRLPTSTDPNVTLTTLSATPEPLPYKQEELGHPIKGGLRFSLSLPPGGRGEVTITYAIEHPTKLDIVGGGHRE